MPPFQRLDAAARECQARAVGAAHKEARGHPDKSHPSPRWAAIRFRTFATVAASHLPPRAVTMPRPFKAAAICVSDFARAACASAMTGARWR